MTTKYGDCLLWVCVLLCLPMEMPFGADFSENEAEVVRQKKEIKSVQMTAIINILTLK